MKLGISNGKDLIHNKDFWLQMSGDSERQAYDDTLQMLEEIERGDRA